LLNERISLHVVSNYNALNLWHCSKSSS